MGIQEVIVAHLIGLLFFVIWIKGIMSEARCGMTKEEANFEAQQRWGPRSEARHDGIRYIVGKDSQYGFSYFGLSLKSWEDAFDDAARSGHYDRRIQDMWGRSK